MPRSLASFLIALYSVCSLHGQMVPILNYSTNLNGQVQLEINSSEQNYYVLNVRHHIDSAFKLPTSIALGESNTMFISEPLGKYPLEHYQVLEYSMLSPIDTDGDGIDDITEFQSIPEQHPFNMALPLNFEVGSIMINSSEMFNELAIKENLVQWSEFLNGKEFLKYIIADFYTEPKIYFINSNNFDLHADFAASIGIEFIGDDIKKGQIVFHPTGFANSGALGTYAFNYSNGHGQDFDIVQRTLELLASNMPFIENNLSYFITDNNEDEYEEELTLFQNSRVPVLFESDIYADLDYWGLNEAEGFGFFRHMTLEEIPGPREIVLYESLPNDLPRVGGIITSVIQTPLSHVNLRAIQNNIPNAFIRDPLSINSISSLLGDYIYFKVEQETYTIRKATLEEVNAWYESIRPTEIQIPPLDLSYQSVLPLDEVDFDMFDGFGAKCANVATMRTFGFPNKTIPNGFGVPFYFYQEFMEYNNFFEEVESIMNDPNFQGDRIVRDEMLKAFRDKIKAADLPNWMMLDLNEMHVSFPSGTSVRCRSSSNNEDLAGFNGAGLYTSKTQHPDEGHISKSIKQVYASLWNLRAFEERDFYRIDQFATSMGVLCHPNYSGEKANGVGVSADPVYNTQNTYYLNSQIGEELITNPDTNSIPEEILLDEYLDGETAFFVVQHSNLIPDDETIMSKEHLGEMREFLSVIHSEFELLYNAEGNDTFAMDIEYKITSDDQLIIKQARPWVTFVLKTDPVITDGDMLDLTIFPNPSHDYLNVQCDNCKLNKIQITNILGQQFKEYTFSNTATSSYRIPVHELPTGVYILSGSEENNVHYRAKTFIKSSD